MKVDPIDFQNSVFSVMRVWDMNIVFINILNVSVFILFVNLFSSSFVCILSLVKVLVFLFLHFLYVQYKYFYYFLFQY